MSRGGGEVRKKKKIQQMQKVQQKKLRKLCSSACTRFRGRHQGGLHELLHLALHAGEWIQITPRATPVVIPRCVQCLLGLLKLLPGQGKAKKKCQNKNAPIPWTNP